MTFPRTLRALRLVLVGALIAGGATVVSAAPASASSRYEWRGAVSKNYYSGDHKARVHVRTAVQHDKKAHTWRTYVRVTCQWNPLGLGWDTVNCGFGEVGLAMYDRNGKHERWHHHWENFDDSNGTRAFFSTWKKVSSKDRKIQAETHFMDARIVNRRVCPNSECESKSGKV